MWGIGVGVCSSVIPYVTDQLAMARLPRATFSLMLALLPATAAVIGLIVLGQVPTVRDLAGIGLVILGVALHRDRDIPPRAAAPPMPGPARPGGRGQDLGSPASGVLLTAAGRGSTLARWMSLSWWVGAGPAGWRRRGPSAGRGPIRWWWRGPMRSPRRGGSAMIISG
jgi:hypothetical protein